MLSLFDPPSEMRCTDRQTPFHRNQWVQAARYIVGMVRVARTRTGASREARKTRGDVNRSSYKRARRAINSGFYLEAIVLVESMLADRLEAILTVLSGRPATFRTANQAARDLQNFPRYTNSDLLQQVRVWSYGRSRWVHEFAKVSNEEHLSWRNRIADARDVSVMGFDLLTRVAAEARRVGRTASS